MTCTICVTIIQDLENWLTSETTEDEVLKLHFLSKLSKSGGVNRTLYGVGGGWGFSHSLGFHDSTFTHTLPPSLSRRYPGLYVRQDT